MGRRHRVTPDRRAIGGRPPRRWPSRYERLFPGLSTEPTTLPEPLLYLSPFFEARPDRYYDALQAVRERGDADSWVQLFLEAVSTQAADAVLRAERLLDLSERYRTTVRSTTRGAATQLVELTIEQPVLTTKIVEERLGITRPAALKALRRLEDVGILVAAPGGPRRQLRWRAEDVLSVLSDGL